MVSYQDICKANETLKFSDIKGKNYAEVPQRVKAFRMLYPQGFIITEMISNNGGLCIMKASVGYYDESGNAYTLGTGTAYEKENSSFINKTSYIENCETSAVGRALGFLNIGSDSSIASYEEVANAIKQQEGEAPKFNYNAVDDIQAFCQKHGMNSRDFASFRNACIEAGLCERVAYENMTKEQCQQTLNAIEKNYFPDGENK